MDDALLQKTYTTDFLTKKRIKNNGDIPQYYDEVDHEEIIPKELFMQVQAELVRRRVVHVSPTGKNGMDTINNEETKAEDLIDEKFKNSAFYKNSKTRKDYLDLSDDRKEILDKMNTDGKYPLTIEEAKNSGMFKLPIHKSEWIYPFMIDRNNSGEVGEYDGVFDDSQPSDKKSSENPNSELVTNQEQVNQDQSKQCQKVEPIQSQEKVVTESSTKTVDQQGQAQTESSPKLITYNDRPSLAQTESKYKLPYLSLYKYYIL